MKIGILTFHDTNNFGSLLQTYALYKVLSEKYTECEVIDYRCNALCEREIPKTLTQLRTVKEVYRYIRYHDKLQKKYKNLVKFSEKNIHTSKPYNIGTVKELSESYDCIIVGSDIVWGLDITGEDYTYFLASIDCPYKYAYASSFGSDDILNDSRKERVGEYLKQFMAIAVREEDAVSIVKQISGKDAQLVLDPTLLLSEPEWKPFIAPRQIQEPYILTYFEDEQGVVEKNAKMLKENTGLPVYNVTNGKHMSGVNNRAVYSLEGFLSYIYYADYVVTASYHGMAFSINFNKQFYFFNRCHKSRMQTLAGIADLSDRELLNNVDYRDGTIDYALVNERIDKWRNTSFEFLNGIFEYGN